MQEEQGHSNHAKLWIYENELFDSRLIQGDNLLALRALEAEFTGNVKCVFIDPPLQQGQGGRNIPEGSIRYRYGAGHWLLV